MHFSLPINIFNGLSYTDTEKIFTAC